MNALKKEEDCVIMEISSVIDGPFLLKHLIYSTPCPICDSDIEFDDDSDTNSIAKCSANEHIIKFVIKKLETDYLNINIDFAPIGSFEAFMKDEPIPKGEEFLD